MVLLDKGMDHIQILGDQNVEGTVFDRGRIRNGIETGHFSLLVDNSGLGYTPHSIFFLSYNFSYVTGTGWHHAIL